MSPWATLPSIEANRSQIDSPAAVCRRRPFDLERRGRRSPDELRVSSLIALLSLQRFFVAATDMAGAAQNRLP